MESTTFNALASAPSRMVEPLLKGSRKRTHLVAMEVIENAPKSCNWSSLPAELWANIAEHLDHQATTLLSRTSQQFRAWLSVQQFKDIDSVAAWERGTRVSLLRKPSADKILAHAYLEALLATRDQEKYVDNPLSVFSQYGPDVILARYLGNSKRERQNLGPWARACRQLSGLSYLLTFGYDSPSTLKLAVVEVRRRMAKLMHLCDEAQALAKLAEIGSLLFRSDPSMPIPLLQLLREGFILPFSGESVLSLVNEVSRLTGDQCQLAILYLRGANIGCVSTVVSDSSTAESRIGIVRPEQWKKAGEEIAPNARFIKFRPSILAAASTWGSNPKAVLKMIDCVVTSDDLFGQVDPQTRWSAFVKARREFQQWLDQGFAK